MKKATDYTERALVLAMKEYSRATEAKSAVDAIRASSKCSSPAHTALSMYLSGCIDQLRCLLFLMSGSDYEFLEDMEEEAASIAPDFERVAEEWSQRRSEKSRGNRE